jgi:hypothetical protein
MWPDVLMHNNLQQNVIIFYGSDTIDLGERGRVDEISVWRAGWLRYKTSIRVVRLRVRVMVTRERKTRVFINITFNC